MSTTLCKWSEKAIDDNFVALSKIVKKPRYVCRNCARATRQPRYLCKPRPLEK